MSRLSDLIRQAKAENAELGAEIEREVRHLQERRPFGLNFERHTPESVDLYGRPVRRGDKVRMLPPRGEPISQDKRLWHVLSVDNLGKGRTAELFDRRTKEVVAHPAEDLVVVADHRDVIYPGLVSTDKVERGGDKPWHAVINGENLHALKALLFTHRGKIDAIYIDPPYNTGSRDWKYNNDYVENDDLYRHSKWLAFMERRLVIAKELLNPDESVLIVTIDEKEFLRLGMLLEQIFPEAKRQMVSSVINPRAIVRDNEFARTNEFIYVVWMGEARLGSEMVAHSAGVPVAWETMRRRSIEGARGRRGKGACGPNQFYAIHVETGSGRIVGRGDPLPLSMSRTDYVSPPGVTAVFPMRKDGTEMNWSLTDSAFDDRFGRGYVRAGKATPDDPQPFVIQYILGGVIDDIAAGSALVTGRNADGSVIAEYLIEKGRMPHSQWDKPSHNAQQHGTGLLLRLLPDRRFPYAKSLYAVEDVLRLFVKGKPNAVILDYFSGSGTTAHAVMRLNKQDSGMRQCISITNNELSASEARELKGIGLRAGDPAWESRGICDYISNPRIKTAITGVTPGGSPVEGNYKFVDESAIADGLNENAEFFTLTYEDPLAVGAHLSFERIAPLLWLRAGSKGRRITSISKGWDVADTYGILADLDRLAEFVTATAARPDVRFAFIVTDDERRFTGVCRALPASVEPVRLYDSYLRTARIDSVRGSR